jgi:RimJ/RimL family protein N-acetyltransferase
MPPTSRRVDEIRTARLLMRRWRDSDRAPFAELNADPDVMRHFPAPLDRAASDAFVDRIEARFEEQGYGLWALEVVEGPRFVGFTGLNPMPEGVPGAGGVEVGWRLARSAWGHGYATEAAWAALEVAGAVGLPEVWSMTAVTTPPSQAVMRRIGLRRHGTFEHPGVPVGHPVRPLVVYRGGRRDWSGPGGPAALSGPTR